MVVHHVCNSHKILYASNLLPIGKYKKRCVNCLKYNVSPYSKPFQVITPQYNYLYPMICDNCSSDLKHCKWCRPFTPFLNKNAKF